MSIRDDVDSVWTSLVARVKTVGGGAPAVKRTRSPASPVDDFANPSPVKQRRLEVMLGIRPSTGGAYALFVEQNRDAIRDSLPVKCRLADIMEAARTSWGALGETERKPYEDLYAERLAAYDAALARSRLQ